MGFGSFWGQTGWPCSKHGSQRQKLLRSSWNWNLVKPNLSLLWHSTVPNLLNSTGSWFQQLYLMASLRMSRRSGQSELKRCVHLTDRIANFVTWTVANCWINWHLTVAKCAVPRAVYVLCHPKSAERGFLLVPFQPYHGNPQMSRRSGQSRTEKLQLFISLIELYKFCDLDGSKLLTSTDTWLKVAPCQVAYPIVLKCVQQKSCQNLCCWLFQLEVPRRGSFSCLSDTAFAHYTLTGDLSSSTM